MTPIVRSAAPIPAPRLTRTAVGPLEHIDTGTGCTLLALHGGMGGYDQSWLLGRALLAEPDRWRLVAPSRPGYLGTSQRLGTTPDEQADVMARLLDALGIDRVVTAAVSAGGPTAQHFALRHPDRCHGLVLVSAPTGPLETADAFLSRLRPMRWLARVPGLLGVTRRRAGADPLAAALRAIPDRALAEATLAHPEAGPLLRALQATTFDRLSGRLPGTWSDTTLLRTLPAVPFERVRCPLLVIHGTADPVVPVRHAEHAIRRAGTAHALLIDAGGHNALFSHLEQVRAAMAAFLATLEP